MIELGRVFIKDEASIVEKRKRVLELAEDLGFTNVTSTRLATAISEIATRIIKKGQSAELRPVLDKYEGVTCLVLEVTSKKIESAWSTQGLSNVFDKIEVARTGSSLEFIKTVKSLPNQNFEPSEKFIDMEKEKFTRLSREEAEERLKESETQKKVILDSSIDRIRLVDKDLRIIWANKTTTREINLASEDIEGQTCYKLLVGRETPCVGCPAIKAIKSGKMEHSVMYQAKSKTRNGEAYWDDYAIPIKNESGDIVNIIEITRDITEQKRAEEELQKAREDAIAANRAKSEFLAAMSHEIRTPLNAVIGMGDLLSETPLTPEQEEYVHVFQSAGENLLNIINDILDISKVEAGHLDLDEVDFDLGELIEKTCDIMATRAHKKGLELAFHVTPDVPCQLVGDPVRLSQILINLIGNAVKFTENGEVFLEVKRRGPEPRAQRTKYVNLIFSVTDTGIGIPPEKVDAIFDIFTQAESLTTRKYGGTGLGLTISKRLVELMGGKIWVESKVGKGSTFYFTVKLKAQVRPKGLIEYPPVDMKGLRILVIDDNATNRMILKEMLSRWGALVTEAEDGEHGLAELKSAMKSDNHYRLALIDGRMPLMDGFELVEHMRRLGIADTTIMMLSSDRRSGDIARCQELGIGGYMVKPIKPHDLLNVITAAMGKKEETHERIPAQAKPTVLEELRSLRILLVEDSPDNRLLILSYLKKTPFRVDIAENGEIAVERFTSKKYDLVLMDMQMPVMDGYTATREIRKWEGEKGIKPTPIVALTAYATKEEDQKSLDAGCIAHLTKPIKKAKLMEAILKYTYTQ
ncbi:MAG: response regulator [Deltaproteobacteria bacterium]|nr:response regulator [Deltaproteobacteria bacterium]